MTDITCRRLAGKTCVATASGAGIGRATALRFAAEGARVIATDIDEAALTTLAAEHENIETRRLDVTDPAAINDFAAEIGTPDVLFNCAGFVHHGTILDCSEDDWDFSFLLNVRSAHRMMKAFIPGMIENGGGSIVIVASAASSVKGAPDRYVYGATKAALIGMTKAVAIDYVDRGIRVNAICPGTVESPSLEGRMRAQGDYETARAAFIARQKMGRLGKPEEIAALAAYLASDESSFVTAQAHVIDGGWTN
ncbi:MAG: SDR family oxidoreductase [Pseudomonadota bacterium]